VRLYILTLTWNRCDLLSKLKASLLPALEGIDYTWLIKDNGSDDDTVKVASGWGDRVQCIKYKDNLQNFSEGTNYLFDIAAPQDDDLILLLNNDIIINDKQSIKKMISLLNDDVGIVGTKLLYTGTNKLQHAGVVFSGAYGLPINYRSGQKDDERASQNRYFQAVTGAVMLTKAGNYRSIHTNKSGIRGLDAEYIFCFEDVDMCLHTVYNMKKKVIYCGNTNISHEESASLKKNAINKLFLSKNATYFLNKWRSKYKIDMQNYLSHNNHNIVK
jgi:GT2 family glycosyltransferase